MKNGNFETAQEAAKWNIGCALALFGCQVGNVLLVLSGWFNLTEIEAIGAIVIGFVVFCSVAFMLIFKASKIKRTGVWK